MNNSSSSNSSHTVGNMCIYEKSHTTLQPYVGDSSNNFNYNTPSSSSSSSSQHSANAGSGGNNSGMLFPCDVPAFLDDTIASNDAKPILKDMKMVSKVYINIVDICITITNTIIIIIIIL